MLGLGLLLLPSVCFGSRISDALAVADTGTEDGSAALCASARSPAVAAIIVTGTGSDTTSLVEFRTLTVYLTLSANDTSTRSVVSVAPISQRPVRCVRVIAPTPRETPHSSGDDTSIGVSTIGVVIDFPRSSGNPLRVNIDDKREDFLGGTPSSRLGLVSMHSTLRSRTTEALRIVVLGSGRKDTESGMTSKGPQALVGDDRTTCEEVPGSDGDLGGGER